MAGSANTAAARSSCEQGASDDFGKVVELLTDATWLPRRPARDVNGKPYSRPMLRRAPGLGRNDK